jgi:signal transduction histidine kinase
MLAGFSSVLVVLAGSSSSNSSGLLLAIMVPALILIPSAMAWHAHLPGAAVAAVVLLLFIFQHGRSLQRAMLESIQLRQRADELARSLRREQERAQEAIRQQDILTERQRVTRDLHDGLGSTLVSTLVALERGAVSAEAVPAILRECVDDLRIVIDSLELSEPDLVVLLGSLRHRLGPRLESAGLSLRWEVDDLPRLSWLGPSHTLQVMRIVQEALTNVLKHARARSVRLATSSTRGEQGAECATILIEDDGPGFDVASAATGRGLKNLKLRAQQLGGALEIRSLPEMGTSVRLSLPVVRT